MDHVDDWQFQHLRAAEAGLFIRRIQGVDRKLRPNGRIQGFRWRHAGQRSRKTIEQGRPNTGISEPAAQRFFAESSLERLDESRRPDGDGGKSMASGEIDQLRQARRQKVTGAKTKF